MVFVSGSVGHHTAQDFSSVRLFCLPPAYLLALAEIISSTLKMEAICSSETSITTQQTTRHYIPEDDTLLFSKFTYSGYDIVSKMFYAE
jgi:hypothetical protein